MHAFSPGCNVFLRFTSSATPADLLAASIVAKPVFYPHTCMSHVERNHRNIRLVLTIRVVVIVNRFYSLSAQIVELLNFRLKQVIECDEVESTDS